MATVAPGAVVFKRTLTVLLDSHAMTRSGFPSPFKSPIETEQGPFPVVKVDWLAKLAGARPTLTAPLKNTPPPGAVIDTSFESSTGPSTVTEPEVLALRFAAKIIALEVKVIFAALDVMALLMLRVLVEVPSILAVNDRLAAPVVTADKSTPPLPMVTLFVPELPTITNPAKFVSVFKFKVMVSVLPLIMLMPVMPAEGAVSRVPMVAAVMVRVFDPELYAV